MSSINMSAATSYHLFSRLPACLNTYIVFAIIVFYALICSLLRFRRRDAMLKKFSYFDRKSLAGMSDDDAQLIVKYLFELEFPKMMKTSLQFALFKTYGIPSISKLLCATKELASPALASKRYADTSVLITEFMSHKPSSPRGIKALARMNYIHSVYQKAGKITQLDLLYTLSVFMTEPVTWVSKFEWRELTPMEVCALATLWKSIGDGMCIDYSPLRHYDQGWKDAIEFFEDIRDWAGEYENTFMVPAESNKQTANETVALLLWLVPEAMKGYGLNCICVLMGDQLRKAMMYPEAPPIYYSFVPAVLSFRKFVIRYLSPPRPSVLAVRNVEDEPDPVTGRYYFRDYQAHPFYVKPSFWNRWGPEAWVTLAGGGDLPGSKGNIYIPQGYHFEEVGPKSMAGKGVEPMAKEIKRLALTRNGRCPFAFA